MQNRQERARLKERDELITLLFKRLFLAYLVKSWAASTQARLDVQKEKNENIEEKASMLLSVYKE